ncbi:MAG: YhgE/Pip domain-containing protein [Pseudoclavibacter sp.]
MFAFLSTGTELRRFSKGVLPRLAVLVMLFIPLLYGVLYLWAFWDPIGNMNHLPVALVSEDAGTTVAGHHENFGAQVVKQLDNRQDLKWERTSASQARSGVEDGTYYFSVTLPKNFSRQAASPTTDQPVSPQVLVRYNDSNSFLASTLGKEAMAQVRAAIAQQFGTRYAKTALVGLQSARGGLVQATDGSGQVTDGLTTAQDGTQQLNVGLGTLTDGMAQLSSGSSTLSASTQQLAAGAANLDGGAQSLASGAASANAGALQLSDGASQAVSGIGQLQQGSTTLNSGNQQLVAGLNSLYTGITVKQDGQPTSLTDGAKALASELDGLNAQTQGLPDQTKTLASGAATINGGIQQLNTGFNTPQQGQNASLSAGLEQILDGAVQNPGYCQVVFQTADATACKAQAQAMLAGVQGVATGIGKLAAPEAAPKLQAGTDQLNAQAPTLAGGVTQLAAGADGINTAINSTDPQHPGVVAAVQALSTGANAAASGSAQLNAGLTELSGKSGQLAGGASALAAGTSQLASGSNTLAAGTSALSSGSSQLASGASALNEGVASAASGASAAKDGAQQLADGSILLKQGSQTLTQRLREGAAAIPHSSPTTVNAQAKVVGNPTVLKQSWVHNAKVFGVGFAPFFISLALFVGGIITWLLLRALPTRALAAGVSGLRAALSGFLPAALFGIGQVVIMLAVIVFGLGMSPVYPVTTVLFTLLACFSFLALQQMFIITLGPAAGRVVALALLMFQLSSSGGTYPVETTPGFFRAITHYMPITYVVNGLRETITGGIDARFWTALAVLLVVLIGSLAISAASAAHQRQWTIARLHPDLVI